MLETDQPVLTEVTNANYLDTNYDKRFDPVQQEEPHSYLLVRKMKRLCLAFVFCCYSANLH